MQVANEAVAALGMITKWHDYRSLVDSGATSRSPNAEAEHPSLLIRTRTLKRHEAPEERERLLRQLRGPGLSVLKRPLPSSWVNEVITGLHGARLETRDFKSSTSTRGNHSLASIQRMRSTGA